MSNAIKYSDKYSTIQIHLSSTNDLLTLTVSDEGIGIPVSDLSHLFEVFHRANNVHNIHGTGLGLAIVKQAVEAHQGNIVVDSKVNVGTTFIVTLPTVQEKLRV
jgi:signal transduction histidine kinase